MIPIILVLVLFLWPNTRSCWFYKGGIWPMGLGLAWKPLFNIHILKIVRVMMMIHNGQKRIISANDDLELLKMVSEPDTN